MRRLDYRDDAFVVLPPHRRTATTRSRDNGALASVGLARAGLQPLNQRIVVQNLGHFFVVDEPRLAVLDCLLTSRYFTHVAFQANPVVASVKCHDGQIHPYRILSFVIHVPGRIVTWHDAAETGTKALRRTFATSSSREISSLAAMNEGGAHPDLPRGSDSGDGRQELAEQAEMASAEPPAGDQPAVQSDPGHAHRLLKPLRVWLSLARLDRCRKPPRRADVTTRCRTRVAKRRTRVPYSRAFYRPPRGLSSRSPRALKVTRAEG